MRNIKSVSTHSSIFLFLLCLVFFSWVQQGSATANSARHTELHAAQSGVESSMQQLVPGELQTAPWKDGPRFIVLPKEKDKGPFNATNESIDGEWLAYADIVDVARDAGVEDGDDEHLWEEAGIFLKETGFKRKYLDNKNFVNLRINSSAGTIEFFGGQRKNFGGSHSFKVEYKSYEYMELRIDDNYAAVLLYDKDTLLFDDGNTAIVLRRAGSSLGTEGTCQVDWLEKGVWQYDALLSDYFWDIDPTDHTTEELAALVREAEERGLQTTKADPDMPEMVFSLADGIVLMGTDYDEEEWAFALISRYEETFFCELDYDKLTITFLDANRFILSIGGNSIAFKLEDGKK